MSDPQQHCMACDRRRNCMEHMRASHPPTAAKRWLKRTCPLPDPGTKCVFRYTVGIDPQLLPKQEAPDAN